MYIWTRDIPVQWSMCRSLTLCSLPLPQADLIIVLGSSLRVTPAADIPEIVKRRGGKLVICK